MWCGCHGVPPLRGLRQVGPGQLDEDQHARPGEHRLDGGLRHRQRHPAGLRDEDRDHVGHRRGAPLRILPRRARPLRDHRHPHHHVAGHHHAVVHVVGVVDRVEHVGDAERQHEHPEHLDQRQQPEDPVVRVVGGREPGEVDPGPADGERDEREAEHARADVVLRQVVRQLVGRDPERDHEGQVEEQLQRRGRTVVLVRVAPGHAGDAVSERGGHRAATFSQRSRSQRARRTAPAGPGRSAPVAAR